jgi:ribA/ribD-fused uncharacterized protein
MDGMEYASVEHCFQAQKFAEEELRERIRQAPSTYEAQRLGKRFPGLHPDWEDAKMEIMEKALTAKFTQNAVVKQYLVWTGNRRLLEASPSDYFWGIGQNGSGQNMLGVLLMKVRASLCQT